LVVRANYGYTPQGGFEIRARSDGAALWRTLLKTSPDEEAAPLAFSKDGTELYLKSSVCERHSVRGRNRGRVGPRT
jgi:hypothetical protein